MRRPILVSSVILTLLALGVIIYARVDFRPSPAQTIETDILVYGSSLGGTSAAIVAAEHGARVVLATEGTAVGGQAVEAGMSAFDDIRQPWEQWGLYADLQEYLRQQRGSAGENHAGLGDAIVGRAASIPDDIEAFFRSRIEKDRIPLLTEHTFLRAYKEKGLWREADLKNLHTGERVRVRFRYLVDGTTTGKVLALTNTPFHIGIDSQQETGELSALPENIRKAFVAGEETPEGKRIGGFGNRLQAVSTAFALLDRGYPGDFYPPLQEQEECWKRAETGSFIADVPLLTSAESPCTLVIPVTPESTDIYDVYLVHHGGSSQLAISSPSWQDFTLPLDLQLSADQRFTRIGAFPFEAQRTTTFSLRPGGVPPMEVEGVILVKQNLLHEQGIVLRSPFAATPEILWKAFPAYSAELTILTKTPLPETLPTISVGSASYDLQRIGLQAARASIPWLRTGTTLSLQSISALDPSAIIVTPTGLPIGEQVFESGTFDREFSKDTLEQGSPLADTTQPIREWRFTATEDGSHLVAFSGGYPQWWYVELLEDATNTRLNVLAFRNNVDRRLFQPLLLLPLKKGTSYRLRLVPGGEATWNDVRLSISPLALSSAVVMTASRPVTNAPDGIYDLWVRSPEKKTLTLSTAPAEVSRPITLTIRNNATYEYAGKGFLTSAFTPQISDPSAEIIAVPSLTTDVYARSVHISKEPTSVPLSSLPSGVYRFVLRSTSEIPSSLIVRKGQGMATDIPLQRIGQAYLSQQTIVSKGQVMRLDFPQVTTDAEATIFLFEDIPNLANSWTFSLTYHPLFGPPSSIPLFAFRNIVAPSRVLEGKPEGLIPPHVGRNTLGMTLVVNPSNDYSPVPVEEVDSKAISDRSRSLSAAYAYWMRYDAPLNREGLGCDPAEFTCTPKRTEPVIGLFSDRLSPFPSLPYIREGRRLDSQRVISQTDLLPAVKQCTEDQCPKDCLPLQEHTGWCMLKDQSPVLFEDALAAAGYALDLHTFFSKEEYYPDVQNFLTQKEKEPGTFPSILASKWFSYSKPTEVTLGMLLPKNGKNILPASLNTGVTQIANGLYRIHVNEMAIGQSVGRVLSYCLATAQSPVDLHGSALRALQRTLIQEGTVVYPIMDMMSDDLLRKGVQNLILSGALLPKAIANPPTFDSVSYFTEPDLPVQESDSPLIVRLLGQPLSEPLNYRILLRSLFGTTLSDEELRSHGLAQGILRENSFPLTSVDFLSEPVLRGDLFRAFALHQ